VLKSRSKVQGVVPRSYAAAALVGQVSLKGKAQGIAVYRVDRIDPNR
jgi:hypothetical protein